ncbi:MAG: bifunctional UDP-N-acetylglucosamine diphosphorylase/glucosamine-1-phosphate N-acetyltransferase GlmU [Alphaproteobacteria bacterium]|nr:bifunctional UDP-N-acetylglucosamine diphosphorylase/glucosamine-1-phosphate N-acetyltransferase GlmU [Alphaproteobacteria bacterium]
MTQNASSFPPLACVILAAGQGTRMKSDLPKVLHPVAGASMISHVLAACAVLSPTHVVVVVGPDGKEIEQVVAPVSCVVQKKPLGTGDAVKAARKMLDGFTGDVVILFGDGPLITTESIQALQRKRQESKAAIVVAGFRLENPGPYGRLITDKAGKLTGIVEACEATSEQKEIGLCNGGAMLFDGARMWKLLDALKDDNAKKEFFLTDCVALAQKEGGAALEVIPSDDVLGVNTRIELAQAEKIMQRRLREKAMLAGATMTDPDSVFLCADTRIGRDVTIGPNVVFGPGVEIGDRVDIRAFCAIERARIEAGAIVGPFARIRPESYIGAGVHIGNFVEIKNSRIDAGAKINHLSYIGDATVGEKANIGAGTITCNYDGFRKMRTHIGAGAFIGSNSALVAPVAIGDGAYVGAGSVITNEVPAGTLAVARGRQANIEGWAERVRDGKGDKG